MLATSSGSRLIQLPMASPSRLNQRFRVKCGRCATIFPTQDCPKLDHFGIYRVVCPHCQWPGRYLASELHAVAATTPAPRKLPASP